MQAFLTSIALAISVSTSLMGAPAKAKKAPANQAAPKPVTPPVAEPEDVPITSTAWDDGPLQPDALATDPFQVCSQCLGDLFQRCFKA